MNSALQCLSNTPLLTGYFLSERYQSEINRSNPLGTNGKLAEEFAGVMNSLWGSKYLHYSPTAFKKAVARHKPQFQGAEQHDAQEFLAALLDALHEDVNRVKQKPYREHPDAGNRPDDVVALESWKLYLERNQSV